MFMENMSRNKIFMCLKIIKSISFLTIRIAKKNGFDGSRLQFIGIMNGCIAETPKTSQCLIIRGFMKQTVIGNVEIGGTCGKPVDNMSSSE